MSQRARESQPQRPSGTSVRGPAGRGATALPVDSSGAVDAKKLRKGKIYRIPSPDGGFETARWTGKAFVPE